MTRSDFAKCSTLAAVVLTILVAGAFDAQAQQAIKNGDVLTGQLNAMRSRAKGKRVNTFQLVSGRAGCRRRTGFAIWKPGRKHFRSSPAMMPSGAAEGFCRQGSLGKGRRDRLRAGRRADERSRGHEMERGGEALMSSLPQALLSSPGLMC